MTNIENENALFEDIYNWVSEKYDEKVLRTSLYKVGETKEGERKHELEEKLVATGINEERPESLSSRGELENMEAGEMEPVPEEGSQEWKRK